MKIMIDYCPICGEKLEDFELKTRVNHDRRYHSGYHTSQTEIKRNDFFIKEDLK